MLVGGFIVDTARGHVTSPNAVYLSSFIRIRRHGCVGVDEYAARIERIVNALVQRKLLIHCRDVVKSQRRRDDAAGRQRLVIRTFLEANLVSIPLETAAGLFKHFRINVDQLGGTKRPMRQDCFRQRPGSCPEFKQQTIVPDCSGVLSCYPKHRLVAWNKIADRAVKVFDFNAQMSTY